MAYGLEALGVAKGDRVCTMLDNSIGQVLLWFGIEMTWRVRFQGTPSLGISISWIYLAIPTGAAIALIGAIAYWVEGPRDAHERTF